MTDTITPSESVTARKVFALSVFVGGADVADHDLRSRRHGREGPAVPASIG